MKKALSFLLGILMIATAAIPVFAADNNTAANSGPLAITEVAPNPTTPYYEYVEIVNTSDTTVDLRDYYVYRYLMDMSGKMNEWTALKGLLGWGTTNCNASASASLSSISASAVQLETNETVILWLKDKADATVAGFVSYWENKSGVEIDESKVYAIDVTSFAMNDRYTQAYTNSPSKNGASGILPDRIGSCAISLVHKDHYVATATAYATVKSLHENADSIVVLYGRELTDNTYDMASNFYSFMDYDIFVAAHTSGDWIGKGLFNSQIAESQMYPALMMPRPDASGNVTLSTVANKSSGTWEISASTVTDGGYFFDVNVVEMATPGRLVDGQFGASSARLAITEVISSTQGTTAAENMYEFIEVVNTASGTAILDNYEILLNGVTCSGKYPGSMVSNTVNTDSTAEFYPGGRAYANVGGNVKLERGQTAVIWFNNANSGLDSDDFKQFWTDRGNDMTDVTVVEATYTVGTASRPDKTGEGIADRGYGFMPDTQYAFSLYLIDTNKNTVTDSFYEVNTSIASGTAATAIRKELHAKADSVAFIYQKRKEVANLSTNFYGFVDLLKYNAAANAMKTEEAAKTGKSVSITAPTPNTVVKKDMPLEAYYNYSGAYGASNYGEITSVRLYVDTEMDSVPTPGKLIQGQFGYDSKNADDKIQICAYQTAKKLNADGTIDLRIIGWVGLDASELENYDFIGVEIAGAEAATDATEGKADSSKFKDGDLSDAICTKEKNITTNKVYNVIVGGDKQYTIGTYNKTNGYLFAINISGIPTSNCNLTFNCYLEKDQNKVETTGTYQITDTSNENAEEALLMSLKQDINTAMTENTKDHKVLFCGDANNPTLAEGEKAIWVEELFDAYPESTDKDEAAIKAVYVYYPMHDDPSQLTDTQLKNMGATRVFAYLGIPDGATAQNKAKGMVCTHGGGGQAYAQYCLEAVRHGYAAIAFDTEGCYAESGIKALSTLKDTLGHKGKDKFTTAKSALTEQWIYYVISDCAFMNTVLRSLDNVDETKVGITGISWGGMSVTTASCYDSRFAFCIPVYLSYFTSSQTNTGKFGDSTYNPGFDEFAAELWHNAQALEGSRVPTLIINSQKDTFADISSTMMTYNTLKKNNSHAYMLIKPDLVHGQAQGASPAEIYRFADWVCSGYANEKSFYTFDKEITHSLGKSYEVKVAVPSNITDVTATLYYTTEALSYSSSYVLEQTFASVAVSQTGDITTDSNGNSVYTFTVAVPDDAYLYYISFAGESQYDADITVTYTDAFKGKILGSTGIVVVNGGSINA
ncbi:MAG: hypothetical protein E7670_05205 [Ruminococcaceae bacterium]|nr:hypothetical protein [Oscillospiraceae bacterium]